MREIFPEHMLRQYGTKRNFKQTKRWQLREVKKAVNDLRSGCAYSPAYDLGLYEELFSVIDKIEDAQSVKKWGR